MRIKLKDESVSRITANWFDKISKDDTTNELIDDYINLYKETDPELIRESLYNTIRYYYDAYAKIERSFQKCKESDSMSAPLYHDKTKNRFTYKQLSEYLKELVKRKGAKGV